MDKRGPEKGIRPVPKHYDIISLFTMQSYKNKFLHKGTYIKYLGVHPCKVGSPVGKIKEAVKGRLVPTPHVVNDALMLSS